MKKYFLIAVGLLLGLGAAWAQEDKNLYAGGDISLLTEYEQAGARYLDYDGKAIEGSALDFFKQQGMNIMRVRLFVDPEAYNGPDKDPNACQSLEYIKPICKRIVDAGLPLMLDFHYSDFWADPAHQWTPAAWVNLTDEQLYQKIYDYTRESLEALKAEGIVPSYVATGNEISYGMLWGAWNASTSSLKKCYINNSANWARFTTLLKQAGKAVREVCPDAKIVLHTERIAQTSVNNNFYNQMKNYGVDYDIIGQSYYPYFHGPLSALDTGLASLQQNFPGKEIMIVEVGYSYKWEVPGTTYNYSSVYPYSEEGQANYTAALVDVAKKYDSVTGIIWWWPEYNAYGTSLSGWYNAPLFNSLNGRACPAIKELAKFAHTAGLDEIEADTEGVPADAPWYNIQGQRISQPDAPGIYIHGTEKVVVR